MMDGTMITVLIVLGALLVMAAVSFLVIKQIIGSHLKADAARQQVLDKGIKAEATVVDVWETGIFIRHKPQLGLRLNITRPGKAAYEAETVIIATPLQVALLQPGQTITVYVDPNNPENIAM
jgi:hypothetical protein